jgi:hypothetical protein
MIKCMYRRGRVPSHRKIQKFCMILRHRGVDPGERRHCRDFTLQLRVEIKITLAQLQEPDEPGTVLVNAPMPLDIQEAERNLRDAGLRAG